MVLDGSKTIESRLTKSNRVPFGCISAGDEIYIKKRSGPIVGRASAEKVIGLANMTPEMVLDLGKKYGDKIGAGADYWEARRACRYATLIWLRDVAECDAVPGVEELPRGARRHGWFTLD